MDIEYKIIGGDGVEYGPAPLEELKHWIRDGRVAGMTRVWRSDLLAWSTADHYLELRGELATQCAAVSVPAGFWARLAAYIIDHILLAILFVAVWTPIASSHHWQLPEVPAKITDASMQQFRQEISVWAENAMPIFYPIFLLYEVLLNGRFGATIGKMIIGARIITLDGSPIGYTRALLRWVSERITDLLFGIGYLLIAVRPDKRGLHDLLAGTRVVFKR